MINRQDQQYGTTYALAFKRFWCYNCRLEYRLQIDTQHRQLRFCENCHMMLEMIQQDGPNHPRNFNSHEITLAEFLSYMQPGMVLLINLEMPSSHQIPPADQRHIDNLKRYQFTAKDIEDMCYICQEQYKIQELLVVLRCEHHFHEECVVRWLNMHNSCPTCRSQI